MEKLFQSHIVEQLKSYTMILKSWESIQGNQNVPHFAQSVSHRHLGMACTKLNTAELMNVSGL